MKKIISILSTIIFSLALTSAVPIVGVYASPASDACEVLQEAQPNTSCDADASKGTFTEIIANVINILSIVVGAVSVLMLIIGGFRYVVSGGDSNGVQGAKNTILYALVGLVVVLFAQIIVRFVFSVATDPSGSS